MQMLKRIRVAGWKSIKDQTVELSPLTVVIGANGAGKSNLLSLFRLLNVLFAGTPHLLRSCRQFHFHNTSENSALRRSAYVEANRFLYPDAANLASILYLFKEKYPTAYRRITGTVRQMVPDFADFVLEPSRLNEKQIFLNWTHKDWTYEFGPHQLSDGTLRFIALATLLLQPAEKLPLLIALDEPELGLHPAALEILANMARAASLNCQVVFATQSSVFLDHFESENVIVVNSRSGASEFVRLSPERQEAWRDEYTVGEIWEKNVIGGGPYG